MRASIPLLLSWSAALLSLLAAGRAAADVERSLRSLPVPEWRGAPLRSRPSAARAREPALAPTPPVQEGAHVLELARFAFDDYDAPELRLDPRALGPEAYPESIRPYHGATVLLRGYPQPLELDGEEVRLLRLTRFPPGCCYGTLPQYDEWVLVDLSSNPARNPNPYEPLRVRGTLELGEALDEHGRLASLYRLVDARPD